MASSTVGNALNHSIDPTTKVPSYQLVLPDNVGVEVELENLNPALDYGVLKYWRTTTDGSLRDNGLEFVFRQPLGGVDVVQALNELQDFITRNKIKVQLSERTSVHVHLDVRDLSIDEMFNLIVAYAFVERVMMRYCGEERMKNNFCIPIYDIGSTTFLNRISNMKSENTFASAAHGFVENERYSAFNLNALLTYGSIEFRGYHGTYDAAELMRWVNVILSLKKFARETPPAFGRDFHTNISKLGIDHIFGLIFRPDIARYLQSAYTREDLVACIPVVQDLIIMSDVISESDRSFKKSRASDNPLIKRLMYVHNRSLYLEVYGTEKGKDGEEKESKKIPDTGLSLDELVRMHQQLAENQVRLNQRWIDPPVMINPAAPDPVPAPRPRRITATEVAQGQRRTGRQAVDEDIRPRRPTPDNPFETTQVTDGNPTPTPPRPRRTNP